MSDRHNERRALVRIGVTVLGIAAVLAAGAASASAAPASVRGSWLITPKGGPASFQATAAFAAGGVFVTTGSDEAGTGIGQWISVGTNGFGFTYLNFHFGKNGKLSHTTKVSAKGTFQGSTMNGKATLTITGPTGKSLGPPRYFTFTGKRMAVESP